jgi:hypothetical protein
MIQPFCRLPIGNNANAFFSLRGDNINTSDPYAGFSVCHYVGDDTEHIARCRRRLADVVNLPLDNLVIPRQTHSCNVAVIGDGPIPQLNEIDALVTRRNDILLSINTADCLPIVFNDEVAGVIAIAHGGWRGIYGGIIPATISKMIEQGASPEHIHAAIGPAIHSCCYEVDIDLSQRFAERFPDVDDLVIASPNQGKRNLNLIAAARSQLISSGIATNNIYISDLCTRCNSDRLFSARALGVASGRILTAIHMQ